MKEKNQTSKENNKGTKQKNTPKKKEANQPFEKGEDASNDKKDEDDIFSQQRSETASKIIHQGKPRVVMKPQKKTAPPNLIYRESPIEDPHDATNEINSKETFA